MMNSGSSFYINFIEGVSGFVIHGHHHFIRHKLVIRRNPASVFILFNSHLLQSHKSLTDLAQLKVGKNSDLNRKIYGER